jgi:hypothetical protein
MPQQYFYYKAFGLKFKSCIVHPGFIAENETSSPDCTISFGKVPQKLSSHGRIQVTGLKEDGQFLLKIKNVGRYLIEQGKSITIEKAPEASDKDLLLFLWASAIAALLHQRGMIIVHGSAIQVGEHAVIFSGVSGSGKSTVASLFASEKEALILSDDISAIIFDESGMPFVVPGYPLVKLWPDSSEKLQIEWDETMLIRESVNKMIVKIEDRFAKNPVPLSQFYLLSYKNNGPPTISEVIGYKKLQLITGKIFRMKFLRKIESGPLDVFMDVTRILPYVRVCTLERKHGIAFLDKTASAIENDLRQASEL